MLRSLDISVNSQSFNPARGGKKIEIRIDTESLPIVTQSI